MTRTENSVTPDRFALLKNHPVPCGFASHVGNTARARNRQFRVLSALRAHTKSPYRTDLHRETLMALNRPKVARTVLHAQPGEVLERRRVAQGRRDVALVLVHRKGAQEDADLVRDAWPWARPSFRRPSFYHVRRNSDDIR